MTFSLCVSINFSMFLCYYTNVYEQVLLSSSNRFNS